MSATGQEDPGLWGRPEFRAYLSSTAFTGVATAMQQLLVSWMLVGILLLPADRTGVTQAIIGIPGIFLLLLGGASADRMDPRTLLIRVYSISWFFPLVLAATVWQGQLNVWGVLLFGLAMSTCLSYSNPAAQAILNRVAGKDVQRGVTAATAIGFLMQIIGLAMAGQMDAMGLEVILVLQAGLMLLGALMVRRIGPQPPSFADRGESAWLTVVRGLKATYEHPTIFHTLVIHFVSSIFNAGAFMTVIPFIIKRVYEGDALALAMVMIIFFAGATISNVLMFRMMPLAQPGRIFLVMQLSRLVLVAILWCSPPWWLLTLTLFGWGLNMGVTSTLARAIVQESADPEYRGRILSVFSLGLLGSAPIGAIVLGFIIEAFGTLNALIPSMVISVLLFVVGIMFTSLWRYSSPAYVDE